MIDVLVNFVQKEIKAMLDRGTLDPKEREVKLEPREIELMMDEQMCFIKYHVSEDRSSIVELVGGVNRYVVFARTTKPLGILMLNLEMVRDKKWQKYRKGLVMIVFYR